MTERNLELKALKKAALRAKRRIVCPWKTATIIFLALMLALAPVSLAVQASDNVIAAGDPLWKLKNPDGNAQFQSAQQPPLLTQEQAYTQLLHEAIVLLKNENNALPLQTTFDCQGASTESVMALQAALTKKGLASGNGTAIVLLNGENQTLLQEISRKKAAGQTEKIVLLWDTDQPVQPDAWKDCDADAILWTGGVDVEQIAEILTGVAPSGALPSTGAYEAYPTQAYGFYTGYRYYETRYEDFVMGAEKVGNFAYGDAVVYPFGFGLSYTSFAYSDLQVTYDAKTDAFSVTVTVTNTGDVTGRKILQIYAQSPYTQYDRENGVEKSAVELVGFAKTGVLGAGESVTLTLQVEKRELASYDAQGAGTYILDAGDYYLTVADNAHSAVNNILAAKGYTVESTQGRMDADGDAALTYKWTQGNFDGESYRNSADIWFPTSEGLVTRQNWEGTWMQSPHTQDLLLDAYSPGDYPTVEMPTLGAKNGLKLYDMKGLDFDDPAWQTLLDQLTFREMAKLIGDAYQQTAFVASVQAPGTFVGDLEMPIGEEFLSAAFNGELMYAIGYWAGEKAASQDETLLRCFDSAFEDGFLVGKLRAQQAAGMYANGVNVVMQGNDTSGWYAEQAAREHYFPAFQYTAELLPTAGSAKGLTEILRQESGSKGVAIASGMFSGYSFLAQGITIFDGEDTAVQKELSAYENDPVIVSAMRQACHYNLYALANSAAMNGIGENTVVKPQALLVVTLLRVVMALCATAAVVFGILWYRGKCKWQRTPVYQNYQAAKNA